MSKLAIFRNGKPYSVINGIGRYEIVEKGNDLIIKRYSGKDELRYKKIVPKKGLVVYSPGGEYVNTNEDDFKDELYLSYSGFRTETFFYEKRKKFPYFYFYNKYGVARVFIIDKDTLGEIYKEIRGFTFANRIKIRGDVIKDPEIGVVVIDRYGYGYDSVILKEKKEEVKKWLKEKGMEIFDKEDEEKNE